MQKGYIDLFSIDLGNSCHFESLFCLRVTIFIKKHPNFVVYLQIVDASFYPSLKVVLRGKNPYSLFLAVLVSYF